MLKVAGAQLKLNTPEKQRHVRYYTADLAGGDLVGDLFSEAFAAAHADRFDLVIFPDCAAGDHGEAPGEQSGWVSYGKSSAAFLAPEEFLQKNVSAIRNSMGTVKPGGMGIYCQGFVPSPVELEEGLSLLAEQSEARDATELLNTRLRGTGLSVKAHSAPGLVGNCLLVHKDAPES